MCLYVSVCYMCVRAPGVQKRVYHRLGFSVDSVHAPIC